MRITFSKTAYVPCCASILDRIDSSLSCVAQGEGQTVVNMEVIQEWLEDEDNKEDEDLYSFLNQVKDITDIEIKSKGDDIGEVFFSC